MQSGDQGHRWQKHRSVADWKRRTGFEADSTIAQRGDAGSGRERAGFNGMAGRLKTDRVILVDKSNAPLSRGVCILTVCECAPDQPLAISSLFATFTILN